MIETFVTIAALVAGAYLGTKILEIYALAHGVRLVGGLQFTLLLAFFIVLAVIFL